MLPTNRKFGRTKDPYEWRPRRWNTVDRIRRSVKRLKVNRKRRTTAPRKMSSFQNSPRQNLTGLVLERLDDRMSLRDRTLQQKSPWKLGSARTKNLILTLPAMA